MDTSITYIHPAPTSFKGAMAKVLLRVTGFKRKFTRNIKNNTNQVNASPIPKAHFQEFKIDTSRVANRNVFTLSSRKKNSGKYILYIHGGAYVNNIDKRHWDLVAELIRTTGATVVVPDYPLAPNATVIDGFAMVEQVYGDIMTKVSADSISIMGDSAGGGFSLALVQKFKKVGVAQPKNIILISPWLDVSMSNPDAEVAEKEDPILSIEGLVTAGKSWAGELDTKNPLVSPIYGPLNGLGKISVFIGGKDTFIADSRKFKNMMQQKGIPINYFEYPTMFHVWVSATFLKEAKVAIEQIASLINNTNQPH